MPKGYQGLPGQIRYAEENIADLKAVGKDSSFEEGLVEEWRRYLPGGDKHHLWTYYSADGSHKRKARPAPVANKTREGG